MHGWHRRYKKKRQKGYRYRKSRGLCAHNARWHKKGRRGENGYQLVEVEWGAFGDLCSDNQRLLRADRDWFFFASFSYYEYIFFFFQSRPIRPFSPAACSRDCAGRLGNELAEKEMGKGGKEEKRSHRGMAERKRGATRECSSIDRVRCSQPLSNNTVTEPSFSSHRALTRRWSSFSLAPSSLSAVSMAT